MNPPANARGPRVAPVTQSGGLRAVEIADAGVFAALAVVVVSVGAFMPHLGALELLSVVPFAIVGLRHRMRAVIAMTVAAGFTAFLVAGATSTIVVAACAVLGGLCGIVRRHGRGAGTIALVAAVLAPISAALAVGALYVFSATRELVFESLRASLVGLGRIAETLSFLRPVVRFGEAVGDVLLNAWPLAVSAVVIVAVPIGMLLTNALVVLVARRVEWLAHGDPHEEVASTDAALAGAPIAPLPLEFSGVGFRHRTGDGPDALADVDLTVAPGEFIAVVGANGAGKSTLVSLLAGAEPTSGRVHRPGRVGLGLPGGTAIVAQRAETQVIGSTVGEDLRWGLPSGYPVDVDELLGLVGLAGLAGASTDSLSGGQLQRLAVAAALARRPALLISDESTSMLDAAGRAEILELLAKLPVRTGAAVVHVTHDAAEAARADRVIGLAEGRIVDVAMDDARAADPAGHPATPPADAPAAGTAEPVIRLRGVGHRFDAGTPWEVTALRSVDLDVHEGEGVLITGENGSGKTTLAWVLAGLIRPTHGTALLDGVPAAGSVGAVAVSFQHARLQLQRPTVAEDVLAASGFHAAGPDAAGLVARGPDASGFVAGGADGGAAPVGQDAETSFVHAALRRLGLPAELAGRTIDELSGGQMRRVAIAGLLASRPRVLVLDEPLAGLDADSRRALLEQLGRMRREEGLTLVIVSHDFEDMGLACSRRVAVADGTVVLPGQSTVASPASPAPSGASAPPPPAHPRRRGLVLRPVPGTSALHRIGAATKLLALAGATLVSLLLPTWPTISVLAVVVAVAVALARLPRTVIPHVSWWLLATVLLGGTVTVVGSGLGLFARSLLLTILFVAMSLLTVWTTRVEELPAAFIRIVGPLRRLGAPVDEWAHTLALVVRTLPLLREEFRVLMAGRRLRATPHANSRLTQVLFRSREVLDLTIAVVASAARRASDLGRAATLRGGMRPVDR